MVNDVENEIVNSLTKEISKEVDNIAKDVIIDFLQVSYEEYAMMQSIISGEIITRSKFEKLRNNAKNILNDLIKQ